MVNCLKKITFFYLICFLGITAIFCLYYKKNKIEVKMSSYNEEIVFFDYDGKIEGMYLEANKPIEDVFLYYTIKQSVCGAWTVFLLRKSDCISVQNPLYLEKQAGFMQKP